MKCIFLRCLTSPSVDPRPPVTEVDETVHADEESAGASIVSKLFGDFSQSDQRDSLVLASRSVLVATNQTEFTLM